MNNVDEHNGELWVTVDQLENRELEISSLHSKNMYKSFLPINGSVNVSSSYLHKSININACKVVVTEISFLMINVFVYSHKLKQTKLFVTTADDEKLSVKLNYELPNHGYCNSEVRTGEAKTEYFQRFRLEPNTYVFNLYFMFKDDLNEDALKFLFKVGSTLECRLEKLINESEGCLQSFENLTLR